MKRVYKSIEEVKAAFPNSKIYEFDSFFMIEDGKAVSILPKALSKEKIEQVMKENGFPAKYLRVALNEVKETKCIKKVKEMRKKGIILDGPPGIGKSIASVWKIAKLLQHREIANPFYISCVAFPDLKSVYATYKNYDCFMIDDLIATLPQPRLELIIEILYFAELQEKHIFITTNGFQNLLESLPEAIISRLRGYCEWHRIQESIDLRIQNTS